MVNTRQFSRSTYMQDMTKSHTFSAKNQGSTYTPIRLIRREIRYVQNRERILLTTEVVNICSTVPLTLYIGNAGDVTRDVYYIHSFTRVAPFFSSFYARDDITSVC